MFCGKILVRGIKELEKNNLLFILKTLTELMHCPSCGQAYSLEEVQYISQNDGLCLLQVSCKSCRTPVWVNFFVEKDRPEKPAKPSNIPIEEEISADEIIEFHHSISRFDGDFKKVFSSKQD